MDDAKAADGRARRLANLLPPYQPGQSGNPNGRPKGFRRLLRDIMTRRELCGEPVPGGRTVEEALAEAAVKHAIKGNPSILAQVLDRYDGPASQAALEAAIGRVTFEIVSNGRDDPPKLGEDGDNEKSGEIGGNNPSMDTDKMA
jgi:hypothetical protein